MVSKLLSQLTKKSFSTLKQKIIHPLKYRHTLKSTPRKNNIYTQFFRFPSQYKILLGQILPEMISKKEFTSASPLEILVFACCNGAEAYTLSQLLQENFPELPFKIRAYDLVENLVEEAIKGEYEVDDIENGSFMTPELITKFFDTADGKLKVKEHIRSPVSFEVADMVDKEFMSSLGKADLVYAQNVLFHLPPEKAEIAFTNLTDLLYKNSHLFINGMDVDMRVKLTQSFNLAPIEELIEEIHNEARVDRGEDWAYFYWGREPFNSKAKNLSRRYGTIYRFMG